MLVEHAHSAIICGATMCGKTKFILDLLETKYRNWFTYVIIICPTLVNNSTYTRDWLFDDDGVFLVNPKECGGLDQALKKYYEVLGKIDERQVLFIIDDCSALNDMKKKNQMLSELAFSGRHSNCSVWVLTQKYNSVLTDFREQVKWLALFYCKDKDSYNEALRENDVIPQDKQKEMRDLLAKHKHSKLILITEQPTDYLFEY
jgi:hypothetical protein